MLQAEMSVSKILDEKYLKNVAAQDVQTCLSKSGVAEREKEFIRNPRKRSELVDARMPNVAIRSQQMSTHQQQGLVLSAANDVGKPTQFSISW